jgi:hypothetical protein
MATATQQARAPEKKKERPSALRSIIAGSTAGAVEIGYYPPPIFVKNFTNCLIAITYPAECMIMRISSSNPPVSSEFYSITEETDWLGIYLNMTDISRNSRKDKNTIESQISRISKASLATVRQSMVCGMYNLDYWEFIESRN